MTDYPYPASAAVTAAMRGNRRADTKPEVALRAALHARGMRFRKDLMLHTADGTRVKVDIVFPRTRVAVFVDGCFWHSCPIHATAPKSNAVWWAEKLAANVARDRDTDERLAAAGWSVVRVWSHEAPDEAAERVAAAVANTRVGGSS